MADDLARECSDPERNRDSSRTAHSSINSTATSDNNNYIVDIGASTRSVIRLLEFRYTYIYTFYLFIYIYI